MLTPKTECSIQENTEVWEISNITQVVNAEGKT